MEHYILENKALSESKGTPQYWAKDGLGVGYTPDRSLAKKFTAAEADKILSSWTSDKKYKKHSF